MTALVTVVLAFLVLLRGYVASAYVSLLLTYVVAVTTPQPVDTLGTALVSFFGGAVVAGIAAVTMWPSYDLSDIRKAVGSTLSASARVIAASHPLRTDATQHEVDTDLGALTDAEVVLARAYDGDLDRPGTASRRDRGLVQLVNDVTRLRIALRWPTDRTAEATPSDIALVQAVHDTLAASGKAIAETGEAPGLEPIRSAREEHARQLQHDADELLADSRAAS